MFPNSQHNLCAWHIQQSFKSRFRPLNSSLKSTRKTVKQEKIKLYNQIINLPFSKTANAYENSVSNPLINKGDKTYLEGKYTEKTRWVKSYFCCRISTSSRIESKHRVYQQHFHSPRQIELFTIFKRTEEQEISNFNTKLFWLLKTTYFREPFFSNEMGSKFLSKRSAFNGS